MCSFLMTNIANFSVDDANAYQRLRGPDLTNIVTLNGVTFVHNLLSITGAFTPQPFISEGLAAVFNGQIYNYLNFGDFDSDGKCLLPAYSALNSSFVRDLDGEFAIAILDWRNGSIILATDVFGTKPLHYAMDGQHFGVASYCSALEVMGFNSIQKVPANTCLTIGLAHHSVLGKSSIFNFQLDQYKRNFGDWVSSFQSAIKKRTQNCREKIFIGLSSGYDSGVISCELNRQGVPYKSYSIMNNEKDGIIESRIRLRSNGSHHKLLWPSASEKETGRSYIIKNVEPLRYDIFSKMSGYTTNKRLDEDDGAVGLSLICCEAKEDRRRIYLSGQGADEIFADYGFDGKAFYPHSNFGGRFPADLREIFPWPSFYGSTQASYLMKEEYVAGAYGIEARYPYLDKTVVQEFLSLSQHLKNWRYKSVLRNYLEEADFPCAFDEKFGFVP
jgi:asparagine synthetase B (glutamine-hydrolysing)